jgi:hypothetical protein
MGRNAILYDGGACNAPLAEFDSVPSDSTLDPQAASARTGTSPETKFANLFILFSYLY